MLYQVTRSSNRWANPLVDAGMPVEGASKVTSESIKMATLLVTTLPILLVYPFLQKYFVKGAMLGALKE